MLISFAQLLGFWEEAETAKPADSLLPDFTPLLPLLLAGLVAFMFALVMLPERGCALVTVADAIVLVGACGRRYVIWMNKE